MPAQGVSYFTGYQPMSTWGYSGAGLLYPDPEELTMVPPGSTNFCTLSAGESPFAGGNLDAVIRSLWVQQQGGSALVVIGDHTGAKRLLQVVPSAFSPVNLSSLDMFAKGGFSLYVSGTPTVTLLYEVIGQ